MQGQFTNDVKAVDETHSQLSAWCSAKGRIVMNFHLFKRTETYYLLLPPDNFDAILKRLRMYVLRADVQLTDVSTDYACIAVMGVDPAAMLNHTLSVPELEAVNAVYNGTEYTVLRLAAGHLIIGKSSALETVWTSLSAATTPVGSALWTLAEIQAGCPQILNPTLEAFVPQMVNFDLLNGVNFKKGCYTGQEIVARMHYLGKLKKRMYLARLAGDAHTDNQSPQAGDNVYTDKTGQSIGQIVNIALHADGDYRCLVVLQIARVDSNAVLYWATQGGAVMHTLDLPYDLSAKPNT
jgi:folate-binding protein YgfZ